MIIFPTSTQLINLQFLLTEVLLLIVDSFDLKDDFGSQSNFFFNNFNLNPMVCLNTAYLRKIENIVTHVGPSKDSELLHK